MNDTTSGRIQRAKELTERLEATAKALLEKYPTATFSRPEYSIDVIYYHPYFSEGRAKVDKRTKRISGTLGSIDNLDSYFLTEDSAKQAINVHVQAAQQKFEECRDAVERLKKSMDFDVSYAMYGDTYGIHEDYLYIAFKMGGFDFTFKLDE